MSDDNALEDLDFAAWDVPSPETSADELADAVIAQLDGTDVGAAIPVDDPAGMSGRRRALVIGGVAAAVIAIVIGGWTIVRGTRHAAPRDGAVIAQTAQSLDLDGARADLDAGTQLRWSRKGSVLEVEQRAGSASWHVSTDSKIVIDAGAMGASVEATGASLRVEVKPMNAADVKIAGVVATTAAAVAMVTVVVYEGHVKVHDPSTQQTVVVSPGTTYTVRPRFESSQSLVGVAPALGDPAEITLDAGDDTVIHDMRRPSHVRIDMAKVCHGKPELEVNGVVTGADILALSAGHASYVVSCDGQRVTVGAIDIVDDPMTTPLSAAAGDEVWSDANAPIVVVHQASFGAQLQIEGETLAGATLSTGGIAIPVDSSGRFKANLPGGVDKLVLRIERPGGVSGRGGVRYAIVRSTIDVSPNPVTLAPKTPSCDADALKQKGMENINMGQHAAALAQFEASLRCKEDSYVVSLAFMAACNATDAGKAKVYWAKLTDSQRNRYKAMCTRNKIDPTGWSTSPPLPTTPSTTAPPGCDADALKEKGMEHINKGQHAAALAQFEASLRCKDDPYVVSLAFMSACSAKSETKARQYWAKLSDEQQTRYRQMCVRNGIDPASSGPAPAKCDADALKDEGMELINMGQHSAALREFEASLACKNDSYVVMLAFMAACNAHDETKARAHYKRLSTTEQERYRQLCVRNHIDPEAHSDSGTDADDVDGAAANKDAFEGLAAGKGYLQVTSTRKATIMIDGKDTGLTTPITGTQLPLTAGKHKVTYVIGGERFTYPVLIKAGQTEEMTKDIR